MKDKLKVIAYYLPQYHTIPENDKWWGKDFTEWVNVKKAQPLFSGHKQPNIPVPELGYYNLLDDSVRRKQSTLAKEAGIDGFCYWHYWFGDGRELLEKPFKMTLADKSNDFGFCLGWANETWKAKQWNKNGLGDVNLIEQKYCGIEDDTNHFFAYLDAFKDERYLKHENRPIFLIYRPLQHPYLADFIQLWNKLAKENGIPNGFCFITTIGSNTPISEIKQYEKIGFDFVTMNRINLGQTTFWTKCKYVVKNFILHRPKRCIDYCDFIKWSYTKQDNKKGMLPWVLPCWDHSPRSGMKCTMLHGSTPELFNKHVKRVLKINKDGRNLPILFVKSWNEWGEGNYMEPDTIYKDGYIKALSQALKKY